MHAGSKARTARSRRLVVGSLVLLVAALVAVQVDRYVVHRHRGEVEQQAVQARADLRAVQAEVGSARADQDRADARAAAARRERQRAAELQRAAGIERGRLRATERETDDLLKAVEDLQTATQHRVDQLDEDLAVAKLCVGEGLERLSRAGTGATSRGADPACGRLRSGSTVADPNR